MVFWAFTAKPVMALRLVTSKLSKTTEVFCATSASEESPRKSGSTQCAAVSTTRGAIRVPVQEACPKIVSETTVGKRPTSVTRSPPKIAALELLSEAV